MTLPTATTRSDIDGDTLAQRYLAVRRLSEELAEPLSPEDCALQSMPDASPIKWHLAHTTWFFETFLLSRQSGYRAFDPSFAYLFNSYYNTLGRQYPRARRGLISRPGLAETLAYRRHVDERMTALLASAGSDGDDLARIVEIGLHHEQQHQELILTDVKHLLWCNPLRPIYREGHFAEHDGQPPAGWRQFDEGVRWIGHEGSGFAFDRIDAAIQAERLENGFHRGEFEFLQQPGQPALNLVQVVVVAERR